MVIKTKRIELDDEGQWWDILEEMPYGVRVDIRDVINSHIGEDARVISDPSNMVMLVGCSVGWSYSDGNNNFPLDEQHIRELPNRIVAPILREMTILYYDVDPDASQAEQLEQESVRDGAEDDAKKD